MKLKFLGTSAGESYPALWCECENCTYAREHGGRNLRQNSCAVLDDDVLIDLNMTAFLQARIYGWNLRGAKALLVTHAHEDHFTAQHLRWRRASEGVLELPPEEQMKRSSPRVTPLPRLHGLGPKPVLDILATEKGGVMPGKNDDSYGDWGDGTADLDFTVAKRFGVYTFPNVEDLKVTVLYSDHGGDEYTCNYIIERGGKTLLYALDCGGYDDETKAFLLKFRFDAVVMEGTFGLIPEKWRGHMNREKNLEWFRFFRENGLFKGEPKMVLTHMAPHWVPPYDIYAPMMEKEGITVAYDGMVLEI